MSIPEGEASTSRSAAVWQLVERGAWRGALLGAVTGPLLIVFTVFVISGDEDIGTAVGWALIVLFYAAIPAGLIGAIVGAICGALAAGFVPVAARLNTKWDLKTPPKVLLASAGAAGGTVGGLSIYGCVLLIDPLWLYWLPWFPVVAIIITTIATAVQKNTSFVSPHTDHFERMPQRPALRSGTSPLVAGALIAVFVVVLALIARPSWDRDTPYSGGGEYNDEYEYEDEYDSGDGYIPGDPTAAPDTTTLPPIHLTQPSTTYSQALLIPLIQGLADRTIAAAGPIDDPAIPAGTTSFPVSVQECANNGLPSQTGTLEVGFDTADPVASLDRVRELWSGEGYELYESAVNAKGDPVDAAATVTARGADPLPASALSLRIYEGFLILRIDGLCSAP
ncbi:MAG TPA: hypothetical protein VGP24_05240 [Glaciihabitans sp.]|nr:hypothetical protein [Glaciihabitans sp.]